MTTLSWTASALVLVVEVRTCETCSSTYRSPGGLFIRMESTREGYHRSWLVPPKDVSQIKTFLFRERHEVHTPVRVCEMCFIASSPDQLVLWPERFRPQVAYSARIHEVEEAARLAQGNVPTKLNGSGKHKAKPKPQRTLADL